ncbi:MAG TPA: Mur ligase family protein, partial [bacterium]|nr:Mur ligase family protein [bacterium]
MKILKLIEGIDISEMRNIKDIEKIEVNNISSNSKDIKESGLFIAIRGEHFDGHNFIEEAIKRGALLALGEEDIKEFPYIMVPDSKRAYAFISSNYYNNPFREIKTVGVTGTNGKTTTVNLIGSILETLGEKAGIIGTLGARLGSEELVTQFTTPEQLLLAELYNRARNLGINKIVMEVSSQSLAQHRVDAVRFEAGIFTNLTQDHLDFHKDMESYFLSKRRLFEMVSEDKDGIMAINIDDDYGKRLVQEFSSYNLITYGIKTPAMIMAK